MARVRIRLYGTMIEKVKEEKIEIDAKTISEAITKLVAKFPIFKGAIVDQNLNLMYDFTYLLNGKNVEVLNKGDTMLKEGDVISIFPPVAGG